MTVHTRYVVCKVYLIVVIYRYLGRRFITMGSQSKAKTETASGLAIAFITLDGGIWLVGPLSHCWVPPSHMNNWRCILLSQIFGPSSPEMGNLWPSWWCSLRFPFPNLTKVAALQSLTFLIFKTSNTTKIITHCCKPISGKEKNPFMIFSWVYAFLGTLPN